MTEEFSAAAVESAVQGLSLRLPRGPHRGRVGEVRAASVGSSMELHDFREYSPGDDLRHLDWNAVARTGQLVVRVRQEEVSPRVEVVLDASASMGVSKVKSARGREIAAWVAQLARRTGLEATVTMAGAVASKVPAAAAIVSLTQLACDGQLPLGPALDQAPRLSACGVRVVVSDFLFESAPAPLAERLARGAASMVFVQVLDDDDLAPSIEGGVRFVDAESAEVIERIVTPQTLAEYHRRLTAHVAAWRAAAVRVRGVWSQVNAAHPLVDLVRGPLAPLVEFA